MQASLKDDPQWSFPQNFGRVSIYEYNAAIKIASKLAGTAVADLAALGISYEPLDGTHPTTNGHATLANA